MFLAEPPIQTEAAGSLTAPRTEACCPNQKTTRQDQGARAQPDADGRRVGRGRRRASAGDGGGGLRPQARARLGRRWDRLRGAAQGPRTQGGRQGAPPPAGGLAPDGDALRARGAGRQHDQAPGHRRHLRVRHAPRRAAVLRDGAARGHRPALDAQRPRPLPARRGAGDSRAGLRGAAGGARARHRSPRSQGQQHLHGHLRRAAHDQAARLRHRQADAPRRLARPD